MSLNHLFKVKRILIQNYKAKFNSNLYETYSKQGDSEQPKAKKRKGMVKICQLMEIQKKQEVLVLTTDTA